MSETWATLLTLGDKLAAHVLLSAAALALGIVVALPLDAKPIENASKKPVDVVLAAGGSPGGVTGTRKASGSPSMAEDEAMTCFDPSVICTTRRFTARGTPRRQTSTAAAAASIIRMTRAAAAVSRVLRDKLP